MKFIILFIALLSVFGVCEATSYTTTICSTVTLAHSTTTVTVYSVRATSTITISSLSSEVTTDGIGTSSVDTNSSDIPTTLFSFVDSTSTFDTVSPSPTPTSGVTVDVAQTSNVSTDNSTANSTLSQYANTTPGIAPNSTAPDVCVSGAAGGMIFDCGSYSPPSSTSCAGPNLPIYNNASATTSLIHPTVTSTSIVSGTGATENPLNGGYSGAVASFIGAADRSVGVNFGAVVCLIITAVIAAVLF